MTQKHVSSAEGLRKCTAAAATTHRPAPACPPADIRHQTSSLLLQVRPCARQFTGQPQVVVCCSCWGDIAQLKKTPSGKAEVMRRCELQNDASWRKQTHPLENLHPEGAPCRRSCRSRQKAAQTPAQRSTTPPAPSRCGAPASGRTAPSSRPTPAACVFEAWRAVHNPMDGTYKSIAYIGGLAATWSCPQPAVAVRPPET